MWEPFRKQYWWAAVSLFSRQVPHHQHANEAVDSAAEFFRKGAEKVRDVIKKKRLHC